MGNIKLMKGIAAFLIVAVVIVVVAMIWSGSMVFTNTPVVMSTPIPAITPAVTHDEQELIGMIDKRYRIIEEGKVVMEYSGLIIIESLQDLEDKRLKGFISDNDTEEFKRKMNESGREYVVMFSKDIVERRR